MYQNIEIFNSVDGWNFFNEFSPLHLLWIIWMWDMVLQLIPVKTHISIGSQKVFESLFRPIKEKINYKNLKQYIKDTTASASGRLHNQTRKCKRENQRNS